MSRPKHNWSRRRFAAAAVASAMSPAALALASRSRRTAPARAAQSKELVRPPALRPGDRLGLVLPAGLEFEASRIDLARRQLEALGFEVEIGPNARHRNGSLAGTDAERADDLNAMFADDSIRGVICHRGGWGTPRILPLIDYALIRRNPKVLIGFSDITALVNAVHQETGLVTFHGPNGATALRPYTLDGFRRAVMSTEPLGTLANPPKRDDELVDRTWPRVTFRAGRATGPVVGGNLTLLAASMGTPWEIETAGRILLLEDVREELYRVDRMLTQLSLGGKFEDVAGVAFGTCNDCPRGSGPTFSLEEILGHHFGDLGVPVVSGLAFGHVREMMTLPIGLEATLDAEAGTLSFDRSAVV